MNEIIDYIKKAFEYKNSGDYKEAIDFFYKALAIDNESTEVMVELADLYSKLCQYDRAINFYEQIITKNPADNNSKFDYAILLKKIKDYNKAEELLEQLFSVSYELEIVASELFLICSMTNKYEKIISLYNSKANSINSSENLTYVALAYSRIGKEEIALQYYKEAFLIKEDNVEAGISVVESFIKNAEYQDAEVLALNLLKYSENDKVLYLLAEIYYAMALYDNSMKYYSYAIKSNPQCALYYFKIALLFSVKGFFKEAEEAYCKAISLEPNNVVYNYALAYLYYLNNKDELSLKLVDIVLSIDANHTQANSLKLILLVKSNEAASGGIYLKKISEATDKDDLAYYAQAFYYSKLNIWEKALNSIKKAVELKSESTEYLYQLAMYYYKLDDYSNSEKICNQIITNYANYIQAYLLLANIYMKKLDLENAKQNVSHVMQLDKNNLEAYILSAKIDCIKENWQMAIEKYKIAASINPNDVDLYSKIADCYYRQEDYNDAYEYYKEASNLDIGNSEYRYYMAKCCEKLNDAENAIVNYSVLKRISPYNIKYIEEYANFLYKINRKKVAINLVKSALKTASKEEKTKLKQLIEKYK